MFSTEFAAVVASSPDIHLNHSLRVVADKDSAYSSSHGLGLIDFGGLPDSADVDAFHGLPDGSILFSLETSIVMSPRHSMKPSRSQEPTRSPERGDDALIRGLAVRMSSTGGAENAACFP